MVNGVETNKVFCSGQISTTVEPGATVGIRLYSATSASEDGTLVWSAPNVTGKSTTSWKDVVLPDQFYYVEVTYTETLNPARRWSRPCRPALVRLGGYSDEALHGDALSRHLGAEQGYRLAVPVPARHRVSGRSAMARTPDGVWWMVLPGATPASCG